jgi:hypothetical protein
MRTLWLQWGGNKDLLNSFRLPLLPYPLCYNIPRTAWSDSLDSISIIKNEPFCIYIDLLAEVQTNIGPKNRDTLSKNILRSYRICVGIGQKAIDVEIESPTMRDIGVWHYYSRFPDNSNLVSRPAPVNGIDDILNQLAIHINGQSISMNTENFIGGKTLSFLAGFTTLQPGDLVSLGTLLFHHEAEKRQLDITFAFGDCNTCYKILEQ